MMLLLLTIPPLKISFFSYFIMNFQIESKCTHTHTYKYDHFYLLLVQGVHNGKLVMDFSSICTRLWTRKIITQKMYLTQNEFVEFLQHLNVKSRG